MPYDKPYGKTLTDEQSIQFPLCIAAAIHCRYIVVYYKYVIGHCWPPVSVHGWEIEANTWTVARFVPFFGIFLVLFHYRNFNVLESREYITWEQNTHKW